MLSIPDAPDESTSSDRIVSFRCNGEQVSCEARDTQSLLSVLRGRGLTGTKQGCSRANCGACTVLVDGRPRYSCMALPRDFENRDVRTIEGLISPDGKLHPVQEAFRDQNAFQCGFCTPGIIMTAVGMGESGGDVDEDSIRDALVGHLCRCGSYDRIVKTVARLKRNRAERGAAGAAMIDE